MDESLERLVWQRARHICEYCLMPQEYDRLTFEIDHIIAESQCGETIPGVNWRVALLAGNVWLHANEPGKRDTFSDQPPFCVQLDNGFAVASNRANAPRLPLLGLRALRWANLHSSIDGKNCHASIRTARRFWIFG